MVRRPFLFEDSGIKFLWLPSVYPDIHGDPLHSKIPPIFLGMYTVVMLHLALMNISLSYSTYV